MSILSFRRKEKSLALANTRSTKVTDDGTDDIKGRLGLNLLFTPREPLIDFIFVHGLGGGSRKTWSLSSSISHYWPQEWLPRDPDFSNVRIQSFGYDSDWMKSKENCLDIHHIGKSLFGEMCISPCLRDSQTSIVLIGHSMGGLVIKKAYMLAKQSSDAEPLVGRIRTMYFLATPHRGSDSAKLLNNILLMINTSPPYVADLQRGSQAIQSINDEFRSYSDDIAIWSVYETQKLRVRFVSMLIVDSDSATLGYRGEKQIPMSADHRSICKYESPNDPNYLKLRNSLATTVRDLALHGLKSKEKQKLKEMKSLKNYLEVPNGVEDDLANVEDARMNGTCKWLMSKSVFKNWIAFDYKGPKIVWITGEPGVGKSVLAGYVINQLQKFDRNCCYFFFRYGDKSRTRLSTCLRSLALQMASSNPLVRETLVEMQNDSETFDKDNVRLLWQKVFLSKICRVMLPIHYWVIDGLDESDIDFSFFNSVLDSVKEPLAIRIWITSRETLELERKFTGFGADKVHHERISLTDTLADIRNYVESKAKHVGLEGSEDCDALVQRILDRSQGSFLWTVLVLEQLTKSHGDREFNYALENMPHGMELFYKRSLESMTHSPGGKRLAKAVLLWATCAIRPLAFDELKTALEIDIQDKFSRLEGSIGAVCGYLIKIDRFNKVNLAHGTIREFLLHENLDSEYAINRTDAHTKIAKTCLRYLTGQEMKPPRTSRRGSAMGLANQRAQFAEYACTAFSYHLARADPLDHDLLTLTERFLQCNIMSWIFVAAQALNLTLLVRASKNLKSYFNSCATARSPLGRSMNIIEAWITDLVRIVAKFSDALVQCPAAIFSLIPPFCPPKSAINKTTYSGRKLSLLGLSNFEWDDRLSCIDFQGRQTSTIAYGDEFFAVGLVTGTITVYYTTSCQEYRILTHGEPVKLLRFRANSSLVVSCGFKAIRVFDIHHGEAIYCLQAPERVITLEWDGDLVVAALSKNYLATWNLANNGIQLPNKPWDTCLGERDVQPGCMPCAISISLNHKMLAAAYPTRPITLWDLEEDAYYGTTGKKLASGETSSHMITALIFNPNPDIQLISASYLDGELVVIDPFHDLEITSLRANCHTLAASPDGRLLAGGAGAGIIQVYEFDTLSLLYRVKSSNFYIKQLAFSRDGLRFSDVRGSHCNIWEPPTLLRDKIKGGSSEATLTTTVDVITSEIKVRISAMLLYSNKNFAVCGKDNGIVAFLSLKTSEEIHSFQCHKATIRHLVWWSEDEAIISIDGANVLYIWNVNNVHEDGLLAGNIILQSRLDSGTTITQVLAGKDACRLVLSTSYSDYLWDIHGEQKAIQKYEDGSNARKWMQHPHSPLHVMLIDGASISIYAWSDWAKIASFPLASDALDLRVKTVIAHTFDLRHRVLLELSLRNGLLKTHELQLFEFSAFDFDSPIENESSLVVSSLERRFSGVSVTCDEQNSSFAMQSETKISRLLAPQLNGLTRHVAHLIGFCNGNQLIFLNTRSWVCSVHLESLVNVPITYDRHFFIPYDWFAGTRNVICGIVGREVVFARNDSVIVIKNGLEYAETVEIGT